MCGGGRCASVCARLHTAHVSLCLRVFMNGWVCHCHLWKCVPNVECNTAPECLFKKTRTSISGQHLILPALVFLMTSGILTLSCCLLCFILLITCFHLFKLHANEVTWMFRSQGYANAALDTSACLMDTTSLDTVIIIDVQEWYDLILSQISPFILIC